MAIDSKHPFYMLFDKDWTLCRDSYRGERVVKEAGVKYLPATSGQVADGMHNAQATGSIAYEAYKARAAYHNFMGEGVETMIGLMWNKPPVIELPSALEPLLENATTRHEGLEQLLRRINEQQLVTGRLGLMLDLPSQATTGQLPYIATYNAENIINWDEGGRNEVDKNSLNLVVLDETEYVRNTEFEWELKNKYRVLVLGDIVANEEDGVYRVGVVEDNAANISAAALLEPSFRGKKLNQIPFVFINSKDIVSEPDDPPLLDLARLCMTIYRGEADYRQSLFLQGQDTLVILGNQGEDEQRVGAGAALHLPINGDAKFIGVDSTGLSEQRQALENDKMQASSKAGQLVDTRSRERESGEALQTRISAQTATLNQIALAGAAGLERILSIAAEWVGSNPAEVSVTPNLDFAADTLAGKELVDLQTAKSLGAPLSSRSIHNMMKRRELTTLEFEEEMALIESEEPTGGTGTDAGGNDDEQE